MKKAGFSGLGNMGLPMAANLAAAGYEVCGYDVSEITRAASVSKGINIVDTQAEMARDADIVIMMLPDGKIARSVATQVIAVMSPGSLLIDCSTIDVASARDIHAHAQQTGVLCLDAPVSGGVGGATAGTLTFMVGGSEDAFAAGEAVLDVMGQKAVHCGDGGAGQAAKICNNMLLGISMIGACETFALADRLGLDQARLFDVVSTSSGSCWSVNTYCPVPGVGPQSPADNQYKPGFSGALMHKDLQLAMEAAKDCGATTSMGARAAALYEKMNEAGHGDADFSSIINLLEDIN